MAQIDFYGTAQDRRPILEAVFAVGWHVLPNQSYPSPIPTFIGEMGPELDAAISVNRLLYVSGPFSTRRPFFTRLESGDYTGRYVIDLSRGGPLMSLSLPCVSANGVTKLTPGHLFHRPDYWDDALAHSYRAPEPLKEGYAKLKKVILGATVPWGQGPKIRVGREAAQLLDQGKARALVQGRWVPDGLPDHRSA